MANQQMKRAICLCIVEHGSNNASKAWQMVSSVKNQRTLTLSGIRSRVPILYPCYMEPAALSIQAVLRHNASPLYLIVTSVGCLLSDYRSQSKSFASGALPAQEREMALFGVLIDSIPRQSHVHTDFKLRYRQKAL